MKFLVSFALIVAVASAGVLKPISHDEAQINAIIAAIASPSTDPATAVLLEQQLAALLGIAPPSPAIVDPVDPILVVDEAIDSVVVVDDVAPVSSVIVVDEAAPVAPVINPPVAPVVNPSPVSSPLVQVILNIQAPAGAVVVDPVVVPPVVPEPVIVDPVVINPPTPIFPIDPVQPIVPEPVIVDPIIINPPTPIFPIGPVEPIVPEPVIVEPVIVEPVIVGEIAPPGPAITLPETLN